MRLLAKPMLFAAALIWGTSFFIMKNALDVMPVFFLLAIRFTAGAVLLGLVGYQVSARYGFSPLFYFYFSYCFLFSVIVFGFIKNARAFPKIMQLAVATVWNISNSKHFSL